MKMQNNFNYFKITLKKDKVEELDVKAYFKAMVMNTLC